MEFSKKLLKAGEKVLKYEDELKAFGPKRKALIDKILEAVDAGDQAQAANLRKDLETLKTDEEICRQGLEKAHSAAKAAAEGDLKDIVKSMPKRKREAELLRREHIEAIGFHLAHVLQEADTLKFPVLRDFLRRRYISPIPNTTGFAEEPERKILIEALSGAMKSVSTEPIPEDLQLDHIRSLEIQVGLHGYSNKILRKCLNRIRNDWKPAG